MKKKHILLIVIMAMLFIAVDLFVANAFLVHIGTPKITDTNDKFVKEGSGRVYYTDKISRKDLDAFVSYFDRLNYFEDNINIKLDMTVPDQYEIYFAAPSSVIESEMLVSEYQDIANNMCVSVFRPKTANIIVYICDYSFKPVKTFTPKWP